MRISIIGALVVVSSCGVDDTAMTTQAIANHDHCDWPEWGGGPTHEGESCEVVDKLDHIAAHITFDPFTAEEQADGLAQLGEGDLFTHYQSPLLVDDHLYMEVKTGTYTSCDSVPPGDPCGLLAWDSQIWNERAFHWGARHELVTDWTFASDWKPEPGFLAGWEPVFHAVVVGDHVYVPGASGSLHKLDRRTGHEVATIKLPGVGDDPDTFVAGGLAADDRGNVYYNALALVPGNPFADPRNAWLVKVSPDNTVKLAAFDTIVTGAPATGDACFGQFAQDQLPWPPSPDAVPPTSACGRQRPPLNVTPAIAPDGTVVTVSIAAFHPRYTYVVAVTSELSPKWTTSLRGILDDGCGDLVPSDAPGDTTDPALLQHCRIGANPGVDPATNQAPAGLASDQGSSSPVILPDGGVLYGAFTAYNQFRGHLFKLDAHGHPAGTYDFGWDVTPAVYRHHGTYSILTKDNFYGDGQYYMTQLDSHLHKEWTFHATNHESCVRSATGEVTCVDDPEHATGFEWCVNAPAVDPDGNVYANSEDGWVYKIGQGGRQVDRMFLLETIGAAYTPISIDERGRLYSLNAGDLFVIDGGHGHH